MKFKGPQLAAPHLSYITLIKQPFITCSESTHKTIHSNFLGNGFITDFVYYNVQILFMYKKQYLIQHCVAQEFTFINKNNSMLWTERLSAILSSITYLKHQKVQTSISQPNIDVILCVLLNKILGLVLQNQALGPLLLNKTKLATVWSVAFNTTLCVQSIKQSLLQGTFV